MAWVVGLLIFPRTVYVYKNSRNAVNISINIPANKAKETTKHTMGKIISWGNLIAQTSESAETTAKNTPIITLERLITVLSFKIAPCKIKEIAQIPQITVTA